MHHEAKLTMGEKGLPGAHEVRPASRRARLLL
jgi:hypothetical protein